MLQLPNSPITCPKQTSLINPDNPFLLSPKTWPWGPLYLALALVCHMKPVYHP